MKAKIKNKIVDDDDAHNNNNIIIIYNAIVDIRLRPGAAAWWVTLNTRPTGAAFA